MSRDSEKITYRLFALPVNAKTVQEAQRRRFSRVTAFYVLIYTAEGEAPENGAEIAGEDVERLSSADRDWLLGCNLKLIAEDAKRREKEISAALGERLERLEHALAAEKERGSEDGR